MAPIGIAPALRGGAMTVGGIAPALRGGAMTVCVCVALCALHAPAARAQVEADVAGSTSISGAGEQDSELDRWWLGAYFRHLWIPGYMADPWFRVAPSVSNNGFGLTATYRAQGGLNVVMGVGYMPYEFVGGFVADDEEDTDIEMVESDLKLIHLTGSMLWDIEFHRTIALEIGFGLDLGVLLGEMRRTEAFFDGDTLRKCEGPLPPDGDPNDESEADFCAEPENPESPTDRSDNFDEDGEHYDVVEERVPPVILFPMIPHVALRLQPFKHLMIKAEFSFGVVQMWVGVSLHGSFGMFEKGPQEVYVAPDEAREVAADTTAYGRVMGKVVDGESNVPIGGAIVRVKARALSPLTSDTDGHFIVDRLDVGVVRLEVEHPDYTGASCEATIPKRGGDVAVECTMMPRPRVGAISGQLQGEDGRPIPAPQGMELTGPRNDTLRPGEDGAFAAVDLPEGRYRIKADVEGYFVQIVDVEVRARETAMPRIILVKKPQRSVVELRKQEIVITEQIQFEVNRSEILPESEDVLRQVADVLLRHPQIERVEVQGHTDNTGTHERNMELSQARADSVRSWLMQAGVAAERLEAKGYGPDQPIRANDKPANRAKNRRVQFMIRAQASQVVTE